MTTEKICAFLLMSVTTLQLSTVLLPQLPTRKKFLAGFCVMLGSDVLAADWEGRKHASHLPSFLLPTTGYSSELLQSAGPSPHILQSCVQTIPQRVPTMSSGSSCGNVCWNALGMSARMERMGKTAVNTVFEKIIFLVTVMKAKYTGKQTAR